jgi:hypothetical protein
MLTSVYNAMTCFLCNIINIFVYEGFNSSQIVLKCYSSCIAVTYNWIII